VKTPIRAPGSIVLLLALLLAVPVTFPAANARQDRPPPAVTAAAAQPRAGDRLAFNTPPSLTAPPPDEATRAGVQNLLDALPLDFVPNRGQVEGPVDFYVKGRDKLIYFTPQGLTFVLGDAGAEEEGPPRPGPARGAEWPFLDREPPAPRRWVVKMDFVGANPGVHPLGEERTDTVISYFKGAPDEWHTGLPTYRRIVYRELWPGVDLVFYGTVNELKYEFLVHPGADVGRIRLAYRGAEVRRAADGALEVVTPVGGFSDAAPTAYQEVEGRRLPVTVGYTLRGRERDSEAVEIAFALGDYDPSRLLVLDPAVLVYCGYIGGHALDRGNSIAVDGAGNVYVTGQVYSTEAQGFPVTGGPDLTHNGGYYDVFVAKVKADGTGLVYCGYIGGSKDELGNGIAVDGAGHAYVTGLTESAETQGFPVTGGPDLIYNGGDRDAFVAKVQADGTGLDYCGYIGGSEDEVGGGIAVDGAGHAYVTGWTRSAETQGFPVTGGPDLTYNDDGLFDAFVARVKADGTGLDYCGYIGGHDWDEGWDIAVDGAGSAYVTGRTGSSETNGFPVTGGPDLTYNDDGLFDAFVAKVKVDGTGLDYCGYIGGDGWDEGWGIAVDGAGSAYVTGRTASAETDGFPVTGGPDLTYNDSLDAFVAKVQADGTGLDYCGYIGGSGDDHGWGIAVDGAGHAYVTGSTVSAETDGFPVTGGPDLTYNGGDYDAFVARVKVDGTGLDYCGYIGGDGWDEGLGIAVDGAGHAYVTGLTMSAETDGFPVTGGPDLTHNGNYDAFVAKISWTAPGYSIYLYLPLVLRND